MLALSIIVASFWPTGPSFWNPLIATLVALGVVIWLACRKDLKTKDRREEIKVYAEVAGGTLLGIFGILEFSSITAADSATVTLEKVSGELVSMCIEERPGKPRELRLSAKTRVQNTGAVPIRSINLSAKLEWEGEKDGLSATPLRLPLAGGPHEGGDTSDSTVQLQEIQPNSFRETIFDWRIRLDQSLFIQKSKTGSRTSPAIVRSCVSDDGEVCSSATALATTAIRLDPHWIDNLRTCALPAPRIETGSCWIDSKKLEGPSTREGCQQHLKYQCNRSTPAYAMWQSSAPAGPAVHASCADDMAWIDL